MRHVHPRRRFSRGSTEASQKSWIRFVKLIVDLIADPSSFRQTGRRDAGALDPAFRLGEIKARDRSDRSKSPKGNLASDAGRTRSTWFVEGGRCGPRRPVRKEICGEVA